MTTKCTPMKGCSVRAGGAVAVAVILAAALVTMPAQPGESGGIEARAVRVAASTKPVVMPVGAPSGHLLALVDLSDRVSDIEPVVKSIEVVHASAPAPETEPRRTNAAGIMATTSAFDVGSVLGPLVNNAVVGPIVLFGAIFFAILVIAPAQYFFEAIYQVIAQVLGLVPALPLLVTATTPTEVKTTTVATMGDPASRNSAPLNATAADPMDEGSIIEVPKPPISRHVGSTPRAVERGETADVAESTQEAPSVVIADDEPTDLETANESDATTSTSASETARSADPRPTAVGDGTTPRQAADGDGSLPAKPARPSSSASASTSSSTGSESAGSDPA